MPKNQFNVSLIPMKEKILIAGASGFIGSALINHLLETTDYQIVALSRSKKQSKHPRVQWRECDLFSLLDIEEAIHDCDKAVYLVHSMLPSARLVQGDFADFDLTLADNFSRACEAYNIKSIVYLSGIIPEDQEPVSSHLKSRREVEQVFERSQVPVVVLRAGIVMGPQGSSFTILYNLIQRLPVMFCPKWTQSKTAPVSIWDMVKAIAYALSLKESKSFDVTNGESFSYQNMILRVAMAMGKSPRLIRVPYFSPRISKLWVSLVSGAPKELVYPLVMSLKNNMLPRKNHRLTEIEYLTFNEYVRKAISMHRSQKTEKPKSYKYTPDRSASEVRTIQRLVNPKNRTAEQVAHLYFEWLPRFFKPWIDVRANQKGAAFYIWGIKKALLVLSYSSLRSTKDRPLYYITGGLLAKKTQRGRLEFRSVMGGEFIIAAIHEFKPKLPWFVYRYTQALIHLWVMTSFNKYLSR